MMYKFIIAGFFSFLAATTKAQEQPRPAGSAKKITIPFYLTDHNNIVVKAVLNDHDTVNLMLHTASSDITLTEEASNRVKTVKYDGTVDSVKSWGGSANSSDFSKNNAVRIGNISRDNIIIWKDKNSGQQTDGKFGLNLFENKIIEFDFNKNRLIVETKLPRKAKKYDKLKLELRRDNMFIKAVCQVENDSFENIFLMHSGYSGGVLLDDGFTAKNKIGSLIKITGTQKMTDAYGNVLISKKGILPLFIIANHKLTDVPAGFFEGAIGRQKMSIIGGEILKRFNWIIDAKKGDIYLKPNNLTGTNFSNA